jgi:hypothetical protein
MERHWVERIGSLAGECSHTGQVIIPGSFVAPGGRPILVTPER